MGIPNQFLLCLDGSTCAEVQKDNDPLVALTLDASKQQQLIEPQESQPVSEKCPSSKPAESHSKKAVVVPAQDTISEQVFVKSSSLVVGNSGVTLSSQPIILVSANLFGNTQEPLYHQH
ncbi:hypothetical protein DSO57_1031203 [Entomophthora muscae]|uniref:Uncharacterized protein n=1 Tax=Entomophthora muscae TaxID=34485 RepID=A0ACC2UAI8_9FUNG|nr:hypothetical protein DSO57_1031203 [Entomophthora muscae]